MTTQAISDLTRDSVGDNVNDALANVAQAARGDLDASAFFDVLLARTVQALGAAGGAVWLVNDEGQCELSYQLNLDKIGLQLDAPSLQSHERLLLTIVEGEPPRVVAPHAKNGDFRASNPTEFALLLGPLMVDKRVDGVLDIFQHPNIAAPVQTKQLRYVLQMCGLASDYLRTARLRQLAERQSLWGQVEALTREVYHGLDHRATCFAIVNEGRRLIGCDRLSLAVKNRRRYTIAAVSGQDSVDPRATAIALLSGLATTACATDDEVWYSGDAAELAPQLEHAMQAYVDESDSTTVAIIPLTAPTRDDDEEVKAPRPVIGALIAETFRDRDLSDAYRRRVAVTADHSSRALANVREFEELFLMPVWRRLGKLRLVTKARSFPKVAIISAAVVAVLIALCIIPCDFELSGKGTLEPVVKRDVFADLSGTVTEITVERGHVHVGAPLAVIDSPDVKTELLRLKGDQDGKQQEFRAKERSVKDPKLTEAEKARLWSEIEVLQAQIGGLDERIKIVTTEKEARAIVTSPIAGDVISWQVRQKLDHRPVEKGQMLMTVAALDQPWNLEIRLPEDRIGHLDEALEELPSLNAMRVSFILASDPSRRHQGTVREIHRAAEVHGEEGNVVLVRVDIDKNELKELRPGAGVTAKFYCGRRSVAYVWFHDVLAFIQAKILF